MMNLRLSSLAVVGASLMAACTDPVTTNTNAPAEPGYRVRTALDGGLNADSGWLAGPSEPATVRADEPFRLRVELQTQTGLESDCVRLQYRRNDGDWVAVEAHDFPYPLRERELTFDAADSGSVPAGWQVAAGDSGAMAVVGIDDESLLRVTPADVPVIALHPAPWDLAGAFSFATEYRTPDGGSGGVGLVFGYRNPGNHWRLVLDDPSGMVRVIRIEDGVQSTVAEHAAGLPAGGWRDAEVKLEAGNLEISVDDDAVEFVLEEVGDMPAGEFGVHVPAGTRTEFRSFTIEGEPSSPRLSIVSTDGYADGQATEDLLDASAAPFASGAGTSLEPCIAVDLPAGHHTELEWPLVIRRFADAALTNESGDVFELRLADPSGRALEGAPVAALTLAVPAGHLGGTFVEAPGRIGPWQASNGDLYFIMEPAESDNLFMMVKSTDGGRTWQEVDGAHRPATGDLESVDSRLVGDTIHILHQVTESTRYHAFRTADHPRAPDTWAVTDELATTVTARAQMATLVVRPDGSMVEFHVGDTIGYSIRSAAGEWSAEVVLDGGDTELAGPQAVLGADGVVHLAYYRLDGSIWHRRLLADGSLTEATLLAEGAGTSEDDWGAVLPLVHLPESDSVVVLYRLGDGKLWERRIGADGVPSSPVVAVDRRVVQHTVDSQQAGADAVGYRGDVVALFIDEADRNIYSTRRGADGWEQPALRVDGILGSWVRGNVVRRPDGTPVYGYVYDAGSFGGAGMNRYGELVLQEP